MSTRLLKVMVTEVSPALLDFFNFLLKHHAKDQNITFINAVIGQALGAEILPKFIIGAKQVQSPGNS